MLRFPTITHQKIDGDTVTLRFEVTDEIKWFNGHFPEQPILPGVVQIDWAIHFANQHFKLPQGFQQMEKIKFTNLITPGQPLTLTLNKKPDARFAFRYTDGEKSFSSGIIKLGINE